MSRVERDSLGEKEIDNDRYYGIQTLRAKENFPISGQRVHPLLIKNLGYIKKAAALMNYEVGLLEKSIAEVIVKAANEIIEGKFQDDFIVDAIQGGAGTSINMNVNEVIANRAIELLGGKKGDYTIVHPNNHVNMSQSTNDVVPTAIKMTTKMEKIGVLVLGLRYASCFEKGNCFLSAIAYIIRGKVIIFPFIQPMIEMMIPIQMIFPPILPKS